MRLAASFAAALLGALFFVSAALAAPQKMSPEEALAKAAAGEILMVDIRTPQEWRQTGVPAPAHLINLQDKGFVADLQKLMTDNPDKPVAMICATGGRSGFATTRLDQYGFKGMIDVNEGMMGSRAGPGWLRRGLALRKPDQPVPAAD